MDIHIPNETTSPPHNTDRQLSSALSTHAMEPVSVFITTSELTQSVSSPFHYPQSTVSSADTHFTSETQTVPTHDTSSTETSTNPHSSNVETTLTETLSTESPDICQTTTPETVSNDTFGCSPIPTWYSIEVIHQSETEVTYQCQDGYRFSKRGRNKFHQFALHVWDSFYNSINVIFDFLKAFATGTDKTV